MHLTRVLVVRDQAKDVSRVTIDVKAYSQFTEGELHHKVRITVR